MLEKNTLKKHRNILLSLFFLLIFLLSVSNIITAQEKVSGLKALSDDIAQIAETVGPAVVNIDVVRYVETSPFGDRFSDPFFDRFFEQFEEYRRRIPQKGAGSGFIVDNDGHI
ncbi:MAG: serine protease, partial [Atribacterota bacterium]|nr:serine protease [Atribacterota bacterium]